MKKIAITGSLGTGKSTVMKILKNLGCTTFSCDEAVRNLYEDPEIKKRVVEIFGKEILEPDEKLNKKKILEKILENQELKKKLEALFHPLVKEKCMEFIKTNKEEKIIFLEVPLLFEVGWESFFDEIWVISCSEEVQKERIFKKGLDEKMGEALLKSQLPLPEKEKRAHRIISTEKSIEDLEKELKEILKEYLKD
uniref:Dephospho-CoA kinase n=1 Tax=Thermodesulfobacterium geofontis TaxID=1295609 RepID=A0A7V5XFQ7_9BACT